MKYCRFPPHPLVLAKRKCTVHRMKWTCTAATSIKLTHGWSTLYHSLFFVGFHLLPDIMKNRNVTAVLWLKVPALSSSWILHCIQHTQTISFLQILIPFHLFHMVNREKLKFKVSLVNGFSKLKTGDSVGALSYSICISHRMRQIIPIFLGYR